MPNRYTGTENDPLQEAQHIYAGPASAKFFAALGGSKVRMSAPGGQIGASPSLGAMGTLDRIGDDDVQRSIAINGYLGDLQDDRRFKEQSLRAMTASNDAADAQARDRQSVERAVAIANTPNVSAQGRPIVGDHGDYRTAPPKGGPIDRQQIAAQMAPGLIPPPAPPKPVTYGDPKPMMVNGKRVPVRTGSDGQMYGMDRKAIDPTTLAMDQPPASSDVSDAVTGMREGTLPPQLPGRASKEYVALLGEAKRQGYDLAGAATDWAATQKHVATMNGAQQLRLNQAVNALPEMLDSVDSLATQWKGGKFPILNKVNLALAKGGAFGPEASSIANQLDAQIADVTADLGNVYMGGNSPTDHALSLAEKSLKGDWDEKVIHDMVKLAKQNVQIRRNSINNTGVAGASADNPYGNQRPPAAPSAPPAGLPPLGAGEVYATDPQGNIHKGKAGTTLPPGWKLQGGG